MGLFGGGNSTSSTLNRTENRDMRLVGGELSTNTSFNVGDGSSANVTLTDHGAVAGGLAVGTQAIDAVVKDGQGLRDTTQSLYTGALAFAKDADTRASAAVSAASDQVAAAYSKVATDLATAFTDSKAPGKSLLMVGGVVAVSLAAVLVFARSRA